MAKVSKLISFVFLVVLVTTSRRCVDCQLFGTTTGATVGDLPVSIATDILTILINGIVQLLGDCSNSNNVSNVQFWLYTKADSDGTVLNSFNQIDASKPIKILIHGWGGNANINYIAMIKNAYLHRYDCNVISVDYSVYVAGNYQSAYCHVPAVGKAVAEFICNMTAALNINLSNLHVVGHSLGAQVAGFMGNQLQNRCGTIGRITGLDPAGPLYNFIHTSQRLDKSDGKLVDIIHTNKAQFGYAGTCGTVDFFPNCGYFQPGCLISALSNLTSLKDIAHIPLSYVSCNHMRSCYLFAESIIYNNGFHATSCRSCAFPICVADNLWKSHAYMGESCKSAPPYRKYTLTTNAQSPHARGPDNFENY